MKRWISLFLLLALTTTAASARERIAWYGNLVEGLEAARQTGKPILLISAAVQCKGVSGIY